MNMCHANLIKASWSSTAQDPEDEMEMNPSQESLRRRQTVGINRCPVSSFPDSEKIMF